MTTSRNALSVAVGVALAGFASVSGAGGFAIGTQSGSGTGNAFAGGSAAAEDASVVWYNPAGMGALPRGQKQVTAAGHLVKPSFKFQNTGSTGAFAAPGTGEGGDGGDWAVIPNTFFTADLGWGWRAGVAVNAPFGLATDYDAGWRGRLTAIKSEIKAINLNPAIAYELSHGVHVGAGVSAQYLQAELTQFVGSNLKLKADDIGYGFNIGVLVQATPSTRVGVSYRSKIKFGLDGDATFSGATAGGGVRADLTVPETLSLSVFHTRGPWEFMADATRTGWDRVQQLVVTRTSAFAGGAAGSTFTTLPFEWKDTWRLSIGANYKVSDILKLRAGIAYDETPTRDATRTPRLPDEDRVWVAAGVQYRISKAGVVEAGYAHEFLRDASVNTAVGASQLVGKFENKADIFSVQYSHSF